MGTSFEDMTIQHILVIRMAPLQFSELDLAKEDWVAYVERLEECNTAKKWNK